MHIKTVINIISVLLIVVALFMIFPALWALYYKEYGCFYSFNITIIMTLALSLIVFFITKSDMKKSLSTRDGFLLVSASWLLVSVDGAIPFYISGAIPSFTDAFFETMSGFTTTGASILTNIEGLPKSMLFWRSLTHWLGGMGIVVLTVAILPLLGIGGLQLIKAEAPGPTVDKITPRIGETAKLLWFIYVGFSALETILLLLGGMNLFDALTHTFGTMATGGFSTKNASIAHFNSVYIDYVITIFMVLAGINFTLHYRLLTGNFKSVLKDSELKVYLFIFFTATILLTYDLAKNHFSDIWSGLRYGSFQAATILTTTGYATYDYEKWPAMSRTVLFLLMFIGGCSGSTGGGIKIIRIYTLFKQALIEMKYLIRPKGIFTLRLSGNVVKKDIVYAISGFFFLYIAIVLAVALIISLEDIDIVTSLSSALATVGNIGPGFGRIGPTENYAFYSDFSKWVLSFAMMIGRLEIYTVLVIFTPHFWKK
ncbi:TrkH family potassium uptake protein [Deferribacter autotrophicus]|uniref:TrkH family potassium uptake protein n=1 Tax=Deferribacter autotrophicus TaxID=500465 RepID=A0A5A8F384_9BACT|nr:TrkH family potassium uptake protein [Deferribacter autotrophicus]KAA0257991.1 TrkH family potassium uptake protein [Deferribacter autotrophicus]